MTSCTEPGYRIGVWKWISTGSDSEASVDDFDAGSSPATSSTPPLGSTPQTLACLMASPDRSTPGALPYHMPSTPSKRPSKLRFESWLPHTMVAPRSSLRPGSKMMLFCFSSSALPVISASMPPSGEPR